MSPRDMGCFALKRLPLGHPLALPLGELSPQAAERASQLFPHIFLPTTLQTPAEYDILISVKNHKLNIGRRSRPRAAWTDGMGCKSPRVGHCEALRRSPERISQIRRNACAAPAYTGTASASDRSFCVCAALSGCTDVFLRLRQRPEVRGSPRHSHASGLTEKPTSGWLLDLCSPPKRLEIRKNQEMKTCRQQPKTIAHGFSRSC